MSEADFEAYLALLSRFLRLDAKQRVEIRRELRAHLEEAIEEEIAAGRPRDEVVLRVLDDFGDAAELAARFSSIGRKRRWIMKGTMAAACVGLGVLVFSALSPQSAPPAAASLDDGAAGLAQAGLPGEAATVQARSETAAADRAIEAALAQSIPEVRFDGVALEDVLEHFRELLGVNVHVYWQVLADAGIDRDAPIALSLRALPADRVLRLVLDIAGGQVQLDYEIDEGVLIIATRERLERRLHARVYDVRDLLAASQRLEAEFGQRAAQGARATAGVESLGGAGRAGAGPVASGAVIVAPGPPAPSPAERLMELIRLTIEADSWTESGGRGSQQVYNGVLVVRQTLGVHRQIERLLNDLREAGAAE